MSTLLTGYDGNVLQANDTYLMNMIDMLGREGVAYILITRNSGYDGSITVQGRPKGSTGAFNLIPYTNLVTNTPAVAALTTGNSYIKVDVSAQEIALVTTARTTGNATVDVSVRDEL